ncbi:hypothetical protein MHYP_G00068900 [Metynnis hypsauchen]
MYVAAFLEEQLTVHIFMLTHEESIAQCVSVRQVVEEVSCTVRLRHPVCLRRFRALIEMQRVTRRPLGDSISSTSIKLVVGHSAYVSTVVH